MIFALALAAGLVTTDAQIRSATKGTEQPIRTIRLSEIKSAQAKATVPLVVGSRTLNLSISFGADYLQYLTVEEGDIKSFDFNELEKGVFFHGIVLKSDGRMINGSVAITDLLKAAFEKGLVLDVPQVRYALTLSPDGSHLGMLRRDAGKKYFVGVHSIQKLRTETVWFVAVNGVMYGAKQHDDLITIVKKVIDAN